MEKSKDCYAEVLFWRRRKRRKIFGEGEYCFFFWRRRKTEKEKEEYIWRKSLRKLPRILRNLCFGFGLKTFANFRGFRYRFRRIWSRKRVSVLVSENLVSEKSLGIGFSQNFGIIIQCPQGNGLD